MAVIPFDKEELADMVWAATGKVPVAVRTQALLVIGEFEGGQVSVHRIEDLLVQSAMTHRLSAVEYIEAERRLS